MDGGVRIMIGELAATKLDPIQEIMGGISAELSGILLGLAHGKYKQEVAIVDSMLSSLSATVPAAGIAKQVIDLFLKINEWTAPAHVVPDGVGGFVPDTNSHYDPKTGRFL
jgi:hypothetical protein